MRSPMVLVLAGMLMAPGASADCACLCVDGGWQTVCGSPAERGSSGDLCHLRPSRAMCPTPPRSGPGRSYPAPLPGTGHCREVQVYDPAAGEFVGARVCDLRPSA